MTPIELCAKLNEANAEKWELRPVADIQRLTCVLYMGRARHNLHMYLRCKEPTDTITDIREADILIDLELDTVGGSRCLHTFPGIEILFRHLNWLYNHVNNLIRSNNDTDRTGRQAE